jgi:hypothetical protein
VKNQILSLSIFLIFFIYLISSKAFAHGGRTDASGCHNCRTGACAGTYHCHGGGSAIISVPTTNQYAPSSNQIQLPTPNTSNQNIKNMQEQVTNNSQTMDKRSEPKANTSSGSDPKDTSVLLASIMGVLGLGYFIFSIFNR